MDQQVVGLKPLTPQENEKLNQLSTRVAQVVHTMVDPQYVAKYSELAHLTRLLIAREWNVKDAYEMWTRWVKWRLEYKADDIKPEDIASEINSGKAFWHGYDKNKNPTLIIKARKHFPGTTDAYTLIRFFLYLMEEGIALADKAGTGQVTVVWDREGVTSKNFDYSMFSVVKKIITLLQDNYAERLNMAIVMFPNFFARSMMAIVKPFLSEKSRNKIKMVQEYKEMKQYFDEDQLLEEHGGQNATKQFSENDDAQMDEMAKKMLLENNIPQSEI